MKWVWEQKNWPEFIFDSTLFQKGEERFLLQSGQLKGAIKHLDSEESQGTSIQILIEEAVSSSKIEGELLNRDSVQSSIKKQLGLKTTPVKTTPEEYGMAEMMTDLYLNYSKPLSHENLGLWHSMLMNGRRDLERIGGYRKHQEPMQVISGNFNSPKVYYEAPPSDKVPEIMEKFINWFNEHANNRALPISMFASLAHLYFEQIHPFEDGNGRIGRALCEKAISMRLGFPALVSLSKVIETNKRDYYAALQKANHSLETNKWLRFHIDLLLNAQEYSMSLVEFTLKKTKLFNAYEQTLNDRQKKVLMRLFEAGPEGFKGGLSAANYQSITKSPSATATRDLKELINLGILRKEGVLKGTRYYLI